MYDGRLEALRLALRTADRLMDAQLEQARDVVRLGETLLRVAVAILAAQAALLALLLTSAGLHHGLMVATALGAAIMLAATLRLVLVPGRHGADAMAIGPDGRALAAVVQDPELQEGDLIMSRIQMLPLHYERNTARLASLVRWRMQGAVLMAASISGSATGLLYMTGGVILG